VWDRQRLGDDRGHPLPWIERGVGILEHHLEPPPPRPQLAPFEPGQILAGEDDAAGRGLDQPHSAAAESRFAAPRLAHQGQTFACCHFQVHPVEGAQGADAALQGAPPHRIIFAQPFDRQQFRLRSGHLASVLAPSRGTAASRSRV